MRLWVSGAKEGYKMGNMKTASFLSRTVGK